VSSFHHAFRLWRRKDVKTNNNYCQNGRGSNRIDKVAEKVPTHYYGISLVIATCRALMIIVTGGIMFSFVRIYHAGTFRSSSNP
jgi:hypothetical protein